MLSILCPHCQTGLTIEERWRGQTINCISCGKQLAVPLASQPIEASEPTVAISTSSSPRRRQKSVGTKLISMSLHLSITAATLYGGYYILTRPRAVDRQPQQVVELKPETKPKVPTRRPKPPTQQPAEQVASIVTPEPAPPPVVEVTPQVSPFENLPSVATLPPIDDATVVTLLEAVTTTNIQLVSNSVSLSHDGRSVLWTDQAAPEPVTVAGLTIMDEALKFRWLPSVNEAAESALRNAIVRLRHDGFQHTLSLRQAQETDRQAIDLSKPIQKIICKCDCLPSLDNIHFQLTGRTDLPTTSIESGDPANMRLRDQTTLRYASAQGAATRLTMKKRGRVAIVEIESRYALPSGDEQPLSIKLGNHKLNQLERLHQETLAAENAISGLNSRVQKLKDEIKSTPRSRAVATAKAARISQLQSELRATQQNLDYAKSLVGKKPAIEADFRAIQQVANLAQQLHGTELAYRFYTLVDGHEVDILIAR